MKNKTVRKKVLVSILSIGILLAISYQKIAGYLQLDFTIRHAGWLLTPFILHISQKGRYSYRYSLFSLASLLAYFFIPHPIFVLFATCLAIFFVLETQFGKLSLLAPLWLIVITPTTKYFFDIFGFPIRLKLTKFASEILNFTGFSNTSHGSLIKHAGEQFAIAPACVGLKTVITSFLIALAFMAYKEHKTRKTLTILQMTIVMSLALFLVILSNFFRIITLILIRSAPDTFLHDFTGIVFLLGLVALPLYFVVMKYISPKKEPQLTKSNRTTYRNGFFYILTVVLGAGLLVMNLYTQKNLSSTPLDSKEIFVKGFDKEILDNGIIKLTSNSALVYIKPNSRVYASDHNPMFCWRGSGYKMTAENTGIMGDFTFYTARLSKNNQILYTAWWYDNGSDKTISQLDWRLKSLQSSQKYHLINITSHNKALLYDEIQRFIYMNLFESPTNCVHFITKQNIRRDTLSPIKCLKH